LKIQIEDVETIRKELREEFYSEIEKIKASLSHIKTFELLIADNKDNIQKLQSKVRYSHLYCTGESYRSTDIGP
jgi:thiamine monophosphate kinase